MAEEKQKSAPELHDEAKRAVLAAIAQIAQDIPGASSANAAQLLGQTVRDLAEGYGWIQAPSRNSR